MEYKKVVEHKESSGIKGDESSLRQYGGIQKSEMQSTMELKREIGLSSAVLLIVSVMIGSGIFISPSSVLEKSGSVALCLIFWAVCGLISYFGALAFAELSIVVPQSGAEYAYFNAAFTPFHKFFGPLPSFLYIWIMVLVVRPAEVAILLLTFSEYVCTPIIDFFTLELNLDDTDRMKKLIGLCALGIITYINFRSVKLYVQITNMFSSLKIIACIVVIVGGFYEILIGNTAQLKTGFQGTKTSVKDIALALYSGLWAFDGWTSVTIVTEEVKAPEVNIPRSISVGVPLVTLLYFMMNVAYMTVLSVEEMISSPAVAITFSERVLGPFAFIIPIAVCLSTFGCALSVQFGVSRLCFVSGREGHMVESFSYIHIRRYTPAPAVVLQGVLTAIFLASGSIISLIEFVSFLVWIFYGLAMLALIIMRKTKADKPRPYKVPLIIPVLITIVAIFLAVIPLVLSPDPQFLIAVGFIISGLAVYYPFVYKAKRLKCMDEFTRIVQILFEVIPSANPVS